MSHKLAKATFWIVISEIIFNLSGFVIHSVVGRILGPAEYGRYALIITFTTMLIILIGNGIPTAMAKYISEIFTSNPPLIRIIKYQAIILQSFLIGLVTLIFFLSAPFIAKFLGDPTLTPLFRLATLIIPAFAAASFYFSYYTGLHQFNIQAFIKTARSFFRLFFIITLAYFFKVKGAIIGYVSAPLFVFFLDLLIDKFKISPLLKTQEIQWKKQHSNNSPFLKPTFDWHKLVNYAWQIILFFLAYELLTSVDLFMVKGILRSDFETGIYNAALVVGRIPYYLFYALTVVLFPTISKTTAQKDTLQTTNIINQSLRLMIILLVPSIILMSVFSQPLINLFYSSRYTLASTTMAILVWGIGFLTIYYVFCFIMSGAEKVKRPMIISLIGLAINIVLNYFLIHQYGIIGSAIATSITAIIITLIMLYYVWIDFKVRINFKTLSKVSLAGTIIYFSSFLFSQGRFLFILWSIILFTFYLLLLYLFQEIKKEDLLFFKEMLIKKKVNANTTE